MKLYRFSPIKTTEEFEKALTYTHREVRRLVHALSGCELEVGSLKIFAHYPEEYPVLKRILLAYGNPMLETPTSLYVKVSWHGVGQIGIRIADPYRSQVGCGDIIADNPEDFRVHMVPEGFVRDMPGREDQFIEFWHPDFDVAAYIKK